MCGFSVLVWLEFILPAILSGKPLSMIEIYTTEPTFVLDLSIVIPVYLISAMALFKKKVIDYKLTPILLTFITIVGLTVISQDVIQSSLGIDIPIKDQIILVLSFVLLGVVVTIFNFKLTKYIKT
jgi:hypothetical protein